LIGFGFWFGGEEEGEGGRGGGHGVSAAGGRGRRRGDQDRTGREIVQSNNFTPPSVQSVTFLFACSNFFNYVCSFILLKKLKFYHRYYYDLFY
jgi:hypothetical protein